MTVAPSEQRSSLSRHRRVAGPPIEGQLRTAFQVSVERLAQIQDAVSAARPEAGRAAARNSDGTGPRTSRGRPPEPGSLRDVARTTGISPRQQRRFKRHVALAEKLPLFKDARWKMGDALRADALLEALSSDQRVNVVPRLAKLDPPTALRILQTLVHPPRGVVPVRPAQISRAPSRSAPPSATAMRPSPAPVMAAMPSEADLQPLVTAQLLVRLAARLVHDTALCIHLRLVAADLYAILRELRRGAPAGNARVSRRPSPSRLLAEAKALVGQVAQRLSDPSVQPRLQRVAHAIDAALLQLPSVREAS
jgi:hypothetical protein